LRKEREWIPILVADDSKDDRNLIERAFKTAGVSNPRHYVKDGEELLAHLGHALQNGGEGLPGMLVLDMQMPLLDGKEALRRIRADARMALLPVILLTTSEYPQDILDGYRLGANSVITKPFSYDEFVELASMLKRYWFDHVELPIQFKRE
jgi:CheY-like chemotaxis protein